MVYKLYQLLTAAMFCLIVMVCPPVACFQWMFVYVLITFLNWWDLRQFSCLERKFYSIPFDSVLFYLMLKLFPQIHKWLGTEVKRRMFEIDGPSLAWRPQGWARESVGSQGLLLTEIGSLKVLVKWDEAIFADSPPRSRQTQRGRWHLITGKAVHGEVQLLGFHVSLSSSGFLRFLTLVHPLSR